MLHDKTMKREIGYVFAAVLCWSIYSGDTKMVEAIVWPFVTYIAAASGLHIWNKRMREESSESPDGRRP